MNKKRVVIVGGGVIGAAIAYNCAKRGHSVTLVEGRSLGSGCSAGNAGLVVPSYCIPISTLSSLRQGLAWLFDKGAPFAIKPSLEPQLAEWLIRFVAACRPSQVTLHISALARLAAASMKLYEDLKRLSPDGFSFERRGWLYAFKTAAGLAKGIRSAQLVASQGVRWQLVPADELPGAHPFLRPDLAGGVLYPDDAHLDPIALVRTLGELAQRDGAELITNRPVIWIKASRDRIEGVQTEEGAIEGDVYVLAAGAWTAKLTQRLGLGIPLQPATGYSLTFQSSDFRDTVPLKLGEPQVVVTPIGSRLRLTGGLELAGFSGSLTSKRLRVIRDATTRYLTQFDQDVAGQSWFGYRPMCPDGLPLVGPTKRYENLLLATGHGTLGVTLAPVTGSLIADYVSEGKAEDLMPISPSRYGL